jgi:hypothetical protein
MICCTGTGSGLLAGLPPGHNGRGAKNGGRHGTTCSQTTIWHAQRRWAYLQVWGSTSHGSSTPIIVPLLRLSERGGEGQLKKYRFKCQKLLLSLPLGPKDANTTAFNALAAKCINPKPTQKPEKDWMSKATWRLIAKRASFLRSGHIWQDATRRMKREIKAAIKADTQKLTIEFGNLIVTELAKEDIKEAFRNLKGWYREVRETQARPCQQTMEHQTNKQEELYVERDVYNKAFPANGMPYTTGNNQPIESKLPTAVSLLNHGQCRGALGIRAEHIEACLRGAKKEEVPEMAASHIRAGKMWHKFVCLCFSVWNTGAIPQQMSWVITVFI